MERPSRSQLFHRTQEEEFDVLVIGGGATGAGIIMDASTRGLKSALIEAKDFGSGTSSRSTKLFHGGIRYLELAFKRLEYEQYLVVKQALNERYVLLKLAPHLTRVLPIVIPVYRYWEALYYWIGVKIYDKLAGNRNIGKSRWLSVDFMKMQFPRLKRLGLKGGVLFFDGQFDDARMNLSLILTAISFGASALNYVKLKGFDKKAGKIISAHVEDRLTGKHWNIRAKNVVNAAGPFADVVRRLDDLSSSPLLTISQGTHFVLDSAFASRDMGLLIPKTDDGRLLFLLPWKGKTLVGTTDFATEATDDPKATQGEIDYLQRHLRKYLGIEVDFNDITALWSGLRPLLCQSGKVSTAGLTRDFKIEVSSSGLISVLGGKWTSYRKMAEKNVDLIMDRMKASRPCITEKTLLVGAKNYTTDFVEKIEKQTSFAADILNHLLRAYGDQAEAVIAMANAGLEKRLVLGYPYIGAEVVYACRHEYAIKVEDVILRRIPLGAIDQKAALQALPNIVKIMGKELQWNQELQKKALHDASEILNYNNPRNGS